jgi:hypothetical protein
LASFFRIILVSFGYWGLVDVRLSCPEMVLISHQNRILDQLGCLKSALENNTIESVVGSERPMRPKEITKAFVEGCGRTNH